jgi:hypothetical protein
VPDGEVLLVKSSHEVGDGVPVDVQPDQVVVVGGESSTLASYNVRCIKGEANIDATEFAIYFPFGP